MTPCHLSPVTCCRRRGATLIEILISMLIIVIASVATLQYFGPTKGYIGKSGNRRAALERARERLEQLMSADVDAIKPAVDPNLPPNAQPQFWLQCVGDPCAWTLSGGAVSEPIDVEDLPNQPMETTIQWRDDPAAGTATPDVLELSARVWFLGQDMTLDDDFHRVHLRTLRTP